MSLVNELVYLEADGGCANCGFKDGRALTIHHLDATEPKSEDYDNKILLCYNCHKCHHDHKGPTTKQLLEIKRRLIIKTLTRPGLNALKQAKRKPAVVAMPFLVNHLIEFGYLRHHGDLSFCSDDDWASKEDVVVDAAYVLTPRGRRLLEKWKLK